MTTDPISNFITKLRNASRGRRGEVAVRSSRLIKTIAEILAAKKFLRDFEEIKNEDKSVELRIFFRTDREPLEVKRVSKPGQRIYLGRGQIPRVRNGLGIAVISTSQGVMTGEDARAKKVGGEFLFTIY